MGFKSHIRHRGFVVEAYYENNRSVIATQRAFRARFALGRNASVPDRKKILLWISNLWTTGSTLKRKSPGRPRTVRTPENVEAVRTSIQQSPKRSARKHAIALGISSRSLRRILHADLKLHPYKMMLAQELSERDHANRRAISAEILEQVPAAAVLLTSDEAHFHISGVVKKLFFMYFSEMYTFFLDNFFHFLYLFKMWEIFMPHPVDVCNGTFAVTVRTYFKLYDYRLCCLTILQKLKKYITTSP